MEFKSQKLSTIKFFQIIRQLQTTKCKKNPEKNPINYLFINQKI